MQQKPKDEYGGSITSPNKVDKREPFKVLCWNIENFTNTPRPSRGKIFEHRINYVCKIMLDNRIDLALIMETGWDFVQVGDRILTVLRKKSSDYNAYGLMAGGKITVEHTPREQGDYGAESYLCIYRGKLEAKPQLCFKDQNYRGGCLLKYRGVWFCMLHAPSATHGKFRARVIQEVLNRSVKKANTKNLVFLGDFNYKKEEQETLRDELGKILVHGGPFAEDGEKPALTSLRIPDNLTEPVPLSEPYDQVWARGDQVDCRVLFPNAEDFSDELKNKHLGNQLTRLANEAISQNYLSGGATWWTGEEAEKRFEELENYVLAEQFLVKEMRQFFKRSEYTGLRSATKEMDRLLGIVKKDIETFKPKLRHPSDKPSMHQGLFRSVFEKINKIGSLIDKMASRLGRGRGVLHLYRNLISDHLPVVAVIRPQIVSEAAERMGQKVFKQHPGLQLPAAKSKQEKEDEKMTGEKRKGEDEKRPKGGEPEKKKRKLP